MAGQRVVVVGAGGISKARLPLLKQEKLCVAAVVDLRRQAAEVLKGEQTAWNAPVKNVAPPRLAMKQTYFHGALKEMLTFLRTGAVPQTHCRDNIKSLAMVFAAIESSRKGRRVPVRA